MRSTPSTARSSSRRSPAGPIKGLPSTSSLMSSGYFNPSVHMPAMPQRNINQEKKDMRGLVRNEILMQGRYMPGLIDAESNNVLNRLRSEQRIAGEAAPLLAAERANTPGLAEADAAVSGSLMSLGPSRIETELERQAYTDLMAGGDLTPEEQRQAIQSARAGYSARGMATGNAATIAEVMNRDQFARGRQQQRQGTAMGVDALRRQRMMGDIQIANAGTNYLEQNVNPRTALFGQADLLSKNRSQQLTLHNQTAPYVANFASDNLQAATAYNGQIIGRDLQLAGMQHDIGMTLMNAGFSNQIGQANLAAAESAGNKAMTGQIAGAAIGAAAIIF